MAKGLCTGSFMFCQPVIQAKKLSGKDDMGNLSLFFL
jgi:hypothetical protein